MWLPDPKHDDGGNHRNDNPNYSGTVHDPLTSISSNYITDSGPDPDYKATVQLPTVNVN